ncbi:ATP-binding cassette domain-containing protein [Amycolatopsis thermophila]|uniref:ATPase subunit of ABC transporter with duplicated ATPase domains n=1 Tax=Amycolatopsis thermophila TaxID=206084 RepID=A0ABU0EYW0_9PSEU|nr:hypothetical protein [Amycolatopsis thermophila]MDQ0380505.1 ATPase subunit of ABC transporter with duplicated ATPase domains [Amycolatopsis thermophila]
MLDGASLTAAPGHRIRLIGENGARVSTLLRVRAGADRSSVERPADQGYPQQEMPFDPAATVAAAVDAALADAREDPAEPDWLGALLADDEQAMAAYAERLELAQLHDTRAADPWAEIVLAGLGFGGAEPPPTWREPSGGRRGRLAPAALLVATTVGGPAGRAGPAIEEPANHLPPARGATAVAAHTRRLRTRWATTLRVDNGRTEPA